MARHRPLSEDRGAAISTPISLRSGSCSVKAAMLQVSLLMVRHELNDALPKPGRRVRDFVPAQRQFVQPARLGGAIHLTCMGCTDDIGEITSGAGRFIDTQLIDRELQVLG